ncbi:MAG: hypothetical protein M1830_002611 [Pleopsidium flavum]|nr:MAG: hypothetical protein M1830_002611 [Pleopsidium flavum]
MKNLTILALATLTAAVPFAKRDVVYQTITQQVIQTVDVTTTIWVKAAPTSLSATTTESALNNAFFDHAYSPSSSSTSAVSAGVSTTSSPAPADSASSSSPSPSSSSSSAAYVAPPVSSYVPPPSSAPAPAAASSSSAPSYGGGSGSSSPSNQYTPSSHYSGDITHYDTNSTIGKGSCGWDNNGASENVIAMPHGMMGPQSNGNSYCGNTVTIKVGDKTATAKVVDKCGGCNDQAIDLSNQLFGQLTGYYHYISDPSLDPGRVHDVAWWFN